LLQFVEVGAFLFVERIRLLLYDRSHRPNVAADCSWLDGIQLDYFIVI